MSTKANPHRDEKAARRQHPARPASQKVETPLSLPMPQVTVQRARLAPKSLTPREMISLQRTVGNQAVGRLQSAIVQLAPNAKRSIEKPEIGAEPEHRSDIVPDLPRQLVDQIGNANTVVARTEVLKALLQYLTAKEAVVNTSLGDDVYDINLEYSNDNPDELATTVVDTGQADVIEDTAGIKITVYQGAFDKGPAQLYSTFRHELIHVAQRINAPDDEATGTKSEDEYIYEDIYEPLNNDDNVNQGRTADIKANLQLPLQEIETHTWEILNADETGISKAYYEETLKYLVDYGDKMLAYLNTLLQEAEEGDNIAKRLVKYWKGYIVKALREAIDAYNNVLSKDVLEESDANDMRDVIGQFQEIIQMFT